MTHEDIELTALPRMDQSLLWAIRTWVMGRRIGEDMGAKIDAVFRHIGVTDAAQPLEGFLWVLSQGLSRTLQVNCTCQATVSPDEEKLLALFTLLGEDRPDEAETLLRGFASERATLLATDCAMRVVLQFRSGGHDVALSHLRMADGRPVRACNVVTMHTDRSAAGRLH